jgi:hypothetical protein
MNTSGAGSIHEYPFWVLRGVLWLSPVMNLDEFGLVYIVIIVIR